MVARKPTPERRSANLTVVQMRAALPRLRRRLEELESFSVMGTEDTVSANAGALQKKYDDTLVETFGNDTLEYNRYLVGNFYESNGSIFLVGLGARVPTHEELVEPYRKGVAKGVRNLKTIIELFEEKIIDFDGPVSDPAQALANLQLHPNIEDAVVELFKGGHYANAVEDACKILDHLVQMKSNKSDVTGTSLMQVVFNEKNPILKFNDQQNPSEKSEQQGMMYLYSGSMLAFRNPRAHGVMTDDPIVALEIIGFVNFLAKALSRTKRSQI